MSDSIQTNDGMLDEDRPCIGCGYNLRGLSPASRCPECGTPIAQSIRGNLLKHSDPEWLERLRLGASLKLWNILVSILIGVGATLAGVLGTSPSIMFLVGLIASGLGLWASFAITTQEPRIALEEDTLSLRKLVRGAAVLAFAGGLLQVAPRGSGWELLTDVLAGVLSVAGVVAMFGEFVYFRRFAYRVPDPKLAKSTTVLMWTMPFTTLLAMIMGFVFAIMGPAMVGAITQPPATAGTSGTVVTGQSRSAVGMAVFGVIGCGGVILMLVLFIWYVSLLTRYKNVFKEAASEARSVDATEKVSG